MDIADILITVIIIVLVIGKEFIKIKKKQADALMSKHDKKEKIEDDTVIQTEYYKGRQWSRNEKKGGDSSKTPSYFTYEDVSDSENPDLASNRPSPSSIHEIHIQEVENEPETNELNLDDPEELKKAIIYSEILKKPYN